MQIIINNTDISSLIEAGGLKWQRQDVESPNAGRTMDGVMHRGRVRTVVRLDISCRSLRTAQLSTLLNLISPEYVTVTYDDPQFGTRSIQMYSNNNPASHMARDGNTDYWTDISFPLIEV